MAVVLVLVVLAGSGMWWWSRNSFPVRHRLGQDVVAQTKALMTNPSAAQRALAKSGRKDIKLDILDDTGILPSLIDITVTQGQLSYAILGLDLDECSSGRMTGGCVLMTIEQADASESRNQDYEAYTINVSIGDDQSAVYRSGKHGERLRKMSDEEAKISARRVLGQTLDTFAANW
ncbi:hypothetical protein [Bifidobacterium bombi]|uniref:hypothetical protein n=1 Tax=Bifidobacterium bombi TaxID=471511 RepID=UPI0005C494F7|nr:hypothetical protein [Bifidobacterium bombi]